MWLEAFLLVLVGVWNSALSAQDSSSPVSHQLCKLFIFQHFCYFTPATESDLQCYNSFLMRPIRMQSLPTQQLRLLRDQFHQNHIIHLLGRLGKAIGRMPIQKQGILLRN